MSMFSDESEFFVIFNFLRKSCNFIFFFIFIFFLTAYLHKCK